MEYQPLQLALMQQSGRYLLRAIQNDATIPLDLLVRESVQNSLDAARPSAQKVCLDLLVRTHSSEVIGNLLSGTKFGEEVQKKNPEGGSLLEIRDWNTVGLNGPLTISQLQPGERHGNLLKLVYEIGQTQERAEAGGSWGLGKTVHYRMGVGLVFYYSRIELTHGCYQERFAATLVEDEASPGRLGDSPTGIAWWGAADSGPLTDSDEIREVLRELGVTPFEGNDTGTSVIIPFLRKDLGPSDPAIGADEDDSANQAPEPWWHGSYPEYMLLSLQRWFCPRLDNPKFASGPFLDARVDGVRIDSSEMMLIFKKMQDLYNLITPEVASGAQIDINSGPVQLHRIFIKNRFHQTETGLAGILATTMLSPVDLKMSIPDSVVSPFLHIYGVDSEQAPHRPVIAFMRSPGMIVRWDSREDSREGWSGGYPGDPSGNYIFGLFVPSGNKQLRAEVCTKLRMLEGSTLESYLRSCEMADHLQWSDRANIDIIKRIRIGSGTKIVGLFRNSIGDVVGNGDNLRLARNLADRLLPRGLGTDGRHGKALKDRGQGAGGGMRSGTPPTLRVDGHDYEREGIRVRWSLTWGQGGQGRRILLEVDSESRPIGSSDWNDDESGLGPFPFLIDEFSFKHTDTLAESYLQAVAVDGASEVEIQPKVGRKVAGDCVITGELLIKRSNDRWKDLQPRLSVKANLDVLGVDQ